MENKEITNEERTGITPVSGNGVANVFARSWKLLRSPAVGSGKSQGEEQPDDEQLELGVSQTLKPETETLQQ